jgi:hypothetical protein
MLVNLIHSTVSLSLPFFVDMVDVHAKGVRRRNKEKREKER